MRMYENLKCNDWVRIKQGTFKGEIGEIIRLENTNDISSLVIELLNFKNGHLLSRGNVVKVFEFEVEPYLKDDEMEIKRSVMFRSYKIL